MNDAELTTVADELARGIGALDGVRGIYPQPVRLATVVSRVRGGSAGSGRVQVEMDGTTVRIAARLATDRAVPAGTVVEHAVSIATGVLGATDFTIELEIASID